MHIPGPFWQSCLSHLEKTTRTVWLLTTTRQVQRWNETLLECFGKARRPPHAHRLRALFEGAGLVDVAERHFLWPTSPWARGTRNKDLGHLGLENLARDAVEALSLALLTRHGGFTPQDARDFAARVTDDLSNTQIHLYQPV